MNYPGGKNQPGVLQWLINQMPPHTNYIEAFAGSGAIIAAKKHATGENIAIEINPKVCRDLRKFRDLTIINDDAISLLPKLEAFNNPSTLIYCDPPYLMHTRRSQSPIYKFELSILQHQQLLRWARSSRSMVMISGYDSDLYRKALKGWRVSKRKVITRAHTWATECVWSNFPRPITLHDYRFLGDNYRERERIKKQHTRWLQRLAAMTDLQRFAMMNAIEEFADRTTKKGGTSVK